MKNDDSNLAADIVWALASSGIVSGLTSLILRDPVILYGNFRSIVQVLLFAGLSVVLILRYKPLKTAFIVWFGDYWWIGLVVISSLILGFCKISTTNLMAIVATNVSAHSVQETGRVIDVYRSRKVSNCMVRVTLETELMGSHQICADHIANESIRNGDAVFHERRSVLGVVIERIEMI